MKDFRVVQAKTPLKVTSYAPVRDFSPPAITVLGEEMNKAQEILYNNVEVTEFLIISPRRLLVRIPDSQVGRPLTSLLVAVRRDWSTGEWPAHSARRWPGHGVAQSPRRVACLG